MHGGVDSHVTTHSRVAQHRKSMIEMPDQWFKEFLRVGGFGEGGFQFRSRCEQPLDEREANRLLQATLKGWVLGSDSYREWAGRAANRRVSPLPRGRPRKIRETPQTR